MDTPFQKTLFIFRRDLRIEDNTGLIFALKNAKQVICAFIFTPEQVQENPYKSDRCLQFMLESLEDLEEQIKSRGGRLYLFFDHPENTILKCIKELQIDSVVVNRDYTPYSIQRDQKIEKICKKNKVTFFSFEDLLLHLPGEVLKKNKKPYTVFTPFYRNAIKIQVAPVVKNSYQNFFSEKISFAENKKIYQEILSNRLVQSKGGRKECVKILKRLKNFVHYKSLKDFPGEDKTTHLSAHLKFTTCSPREIYHAVIQHLGVRSDLIRSLYWRDFFTGIALHFPHVFKGAFYPKFDRLQWSYDKQVFKKWCEGNTGFPIIDAGMRQMNETGFMHNRVRMIVASFLVKYLHIDWRWGEKYFAQKLIDYDPSINNGNWQWVAGCGCVSQPYFRLFNPWTQAIKFDSKCKYIKKWIPELSKISEEVIFQRYLEKNQKIDSSYPNPMIDPIEEGRKSLIVYQRALGKN